MNAQNIQATRWVGVAAVVIAAIAPSVAHAETRGLLMTERFTPASAPASDPFASQIVAQPGEVEGIQIITQATGSKLYAALSPSTSSVISDNATFLRIGFVNVATPSGGGMSLGTGTYADPLPPMTSDGLSTTPGEWCGVVLSIAVPDSAPPGDYAGQVDLTDDIGSPVQSFPFTLHVSAVPALGPGDPKAFKAFVGINKAYYQAFQPIPPSTYFITQDVQLTNLFAFLAAHKVTPTDWNNAKPSKNGTYNDRQRDTIARYMQLPWGAKLFPDNGSGFKLWSAYSKGGATFVRNAFAHWKANGYLGQNMWMYAADEPSLTQEQGSVPGINKLVHQNAPGVKTFIASSPKIRTKTRKLCANFGKHKCYMFPGSNYSNENLWNGGSDDVDAFALAQHRYFGRYTSPVERTAHINHAFDTWKVLQKVRRRGKEIWTYYYFMPERHIPQLVIDGPPSDPRLLFWFNASQKNTGWLEWQIMRWVGIGGAKTTPRNPYDDTVSYITPTKAKANGDTSLLYPGIAPQYGMTETTNPPVSSLRFETVRDGIEDASMVAQYRARFGDRVTDKLMKNIFGAVTVVPGTGYTWPTYSNSGMATRLENLRRTMIQQLES